MSIIEKVEDYLGTPGRFTRKTFMGRAAKVSFGVAAVSVGAGVLAKPARADYCCGLCSDCCGWSICPAPDQCPNNCSTYTWQCTGGGCTWVCGECCADQCGGSGCTETCKCSFAYPLCSPGCPCSPRTAEMLQSMTARDFLYKMPPGPTVKV
jgi:hypothetical protein